MLLRLNTLAKGLSGVRMIVAQSILDFLNEGIHPIIPSKGSVGASGDLSPLSHMALAFMGEGTVEHRGKLKSASDVIKEVGLKTSEISAAASLEALQGYT
jgi:histidine ammonia-lyase